MNYLSLLSEHHLAKLHDWLMESGELCVYIYLPHSGSGGTAWFVHSLAELKSLIAKQDWNEIQITIYHDIQYPIRGTANSELLARAIKDIPDGTSFSIYFLNSLDSSNNSPIVSGETHDELRRELPRFFESQVALGRDPDSYDLEWIYSHPDSVMFFEVRMNQKYYEPFAKDPAKYGGVV
jgi:hypothetical protein